MDTLTTEFFTRLIGWSVVAGLLVAAASRLSRRVIGEPFSPKEGSGVTGLLMFFLAGFQMAAEHLQAAVVITVVVGGAFVAKWLVHRERLSSREDRG